MTSRAVSSLISSDHTPMLLLLLLGRVWLAPTSWLAPARWHAMPCDAKQPAGLRAAEQAAGVGLQSAGYRAYLLEHAFQALHLHHVGLSLRGLTRCQLRRAARRGAAQSDRNMHAQRAVHGPNFRLCHCSCSINQPMQRVAAATPYIHAPSYSRGAYRSATHAYRVSLVV
jgi:hypothetical protein